MLTAVVAATILVSTVAGQSPTVAAPSPTSTFILASQHYDYNNLPYQVDPYPPAVPDARGPQFGFNICNSTTQNQQSNCQTSIINAIDDFCLWAPPTANSTISDDEGETVAWCTKPGHGTRLIPQGALQGVQFLIAPDYIQVVGLIDQTQIDMQAGDGGGEMDPHGADYLGNPIGGLVYTTYWNGGGSNYEQVIEWHNFMGSNTFCFKACNPAGANAANYCQHVFDRIGCNYNAPAAYVPGVFETCLSDDQDFPGVYTGANGQVTTYVQPAESLGPISTMPYTARIPASSSCTTYTSSLIYTGLPTGTVSSTSSSATKAATTAKAATTGKAASGSAAAASSTGTQSSAAMGVSEFSLGGLWVSLGAVVIGAFVGAMGVL